MEFFVILWFILWSTLWIAYFVLDGFDLGSAILMKFITSNKDEKTAIIKTFAPFWDGNEVWLITAGGATFAAFPLAYAKMFSWFYIPLFLVLICLILRGVSIEFRGKISEKVPLDSLIFISSLIVVVLFGVFFGNLWAGVLINENGYNGGIISLLNINGIITAIAFFSFFLLHSSLWLYYKIEGEFKLKIYQISKKLWYLSVISLGLFILFLPHRENPNFSVKLFNGTLSVVLYILSTFMIFLIKRSLDKGKDYSSFMKSIIFLILWLSAGFSGLYPNIIPSKIIEFNLSIFNSSSSLYTLKLMTIVALIFVPIVIIYQIWVYRLLKHKINPLDREDLFY